MRWLWIDRFVAFESGRSATAVKALSAAEDHFADHFPGYPVMPASLILEGLAQTGGILVGEANDFREKVVLAKIIRARFTRDVLAGEELVSEAEIFFAHLDQARSRQIFGDHNFVFTGELKRILGLTKTLAARPEAAPNG